MFYSVITVYQHCQKEIDMVLFDLLVSICWLYTALPLLGVVIYLARRVKR